MKGGGGGGDYEILKTTTERRPWPLVAVPRVLSLYSVIRHAVLFTYNLAA